MAYKACSYTYWHGLHRCETRRYLRHHASKRLEAQLREEAERRAEASRRQSEADRQKSHDRRAFMERYELQIPADFQSWSRKRQRRWDRDVGRERSRVCSCLFLCIMHAVTYCTAEQMTLRILSRPFQAVNAADSFQVFLVQAFEKHTTESYKGREQQAIAILLSE